MKKFLLVVLALLFFEKLPDSQWNNLAPFPSIYTTDIIFSGDTIYASTLGNGFYFSSNAGSYWIQLNSGLVSPEALQIRQLMKTGNIIYAATVDGIYKSTNRGLNWIKKSNGIFIGGGASYEYCASIFQYGGKLFTGAWTGIYSSSDGAEFWIQSNIYGTNIMAKSFTNHQGILFAARENINSPVGYKSTDNGLSWNFISGFTYPMINFFSDGTTLWAGTIHGIWITTNNGLNWESRSNGLPPDPYNTCITRVNGTLVTSLKFGGSGVFRSSNNGSNWEDIGQGLPFLSTIEKLAVFNQKLLSATSAGIWQRNISEIVVGVQHTGSEVPQSFKLYQNYPNPFNPVTKIRLDVPNEHGEKPKVKLVLFNVLGKEIESLVDEELNPGVYEVLWDASGYPSGVYYYRLEAGDYNETRKMVFLK